MEIDQKEIVEIIKLLKNSLVKSRLLEPEFYKNKDLKKIFGLSSNTIIKYREEGVLPYTSIGGVYLYPVVEIKELLEKNSNSINLK